jgi:hypothetical protein
MNLFSTISIFADIGDAVQKVFHKKTGKGKGLDTIEDDIRSIATKNAKKSGGTISDDDLDDYVKTRMGYMKNSFKKLNNPKTDKSKQRVDLIDDTESDSAKWFGRAKGYEGKGLHKIWIDNDGCDVCSANADQGPIPVDDVFDSGDYAPLAHPNCQCELRFVRLSQ